MQLNNIKISISEAFLMHFILTSLPSKYDFFKVSYNMCNVDWTVGELPTNYVQEEVRLRGKMIESVNLASHQVSEKIDEEIYALKVKEKKVLVMASGDAINKVVKYFFYKKKGHLKESLDKV